MLHLSKSQDHVYRFVSTDKYQIPKQENRKLRLERYSNPCVTQSIAKADLYEETRTQKTSLQRIFPPRRSRSHLDCPDVQCQKYWMRSGHPKADLFRWRWFAGDIHARAIPHSSQQ